MTINKRKIFTLSGREYPSGWVKLYNVSMGFWESMEFVVKMSLWSITLKPSKRISIWLVRLINPFFWFLLFIVGQGSFLPLMTVGFFALIFSILLFENTKGMEHELLFIWGAAVPFILIISPIVAFIIMGGGNKEGLGKHSSYNDQTSIIPLNQIKTGRGYIKSK